MILSNIINIDARFQKFTALLSESTGSLLDYWQSLQLKMGNQLKESEHCLSGAALYFFSYTWCSNMHFMQVTIDI